MNSMVVSNVFFAIAVGCFSYVGFILLCRLIKRWWPWVQWKRKGPPTYIDKEQVYEWTDQKGPLKASYVEDRRWASYYWERNAIIKGAKIMETEYELHDVPIGIAQPKYKDFRYWLTKRVYVRHDLAPAPVKFQIIKFEVPKDVEDPGLPPGFMNQFWSVYLGYGNHGPSFDTDEIARELGMHQDHFVPFVQQQFESISLPSFTGFVFQTEQQALDFMDWIEAKELAAHMTEAS